MKGAINYKTIKKDLALGGDGMFKNVILAVFVLIGCVGSAQDGHGAERASSMMNYHESPDLSVVFDLVRDAERKRVLEADSSRSSYVGFLAGIFIENPGHVEQFLSAFQKRDTQYVLAEALTYAGNRKRAIQYIKDNGWGLVPVRNLEQMPTSLMELKLLHPSNLDIIWGASFATGNTDYPTLIVDLVAWAIESDTYDVDDLLQMSAGIVRRNERPDLDALLKKYGFEKFYQMGAVSSAIWSLGSNASRFPFVMEAVTRKIEQKPNSKVSHILKRIVFRYSEDVIRIVKNEGAEHIVFTTDDANSLGNDLQQGRFDTFTRFAQNEFPHGTNPSVAILTFAKDYRDGSLSIDILQPNGAVIDGGGYRHEGQGLFFDVVNLKQFILEVPGAYTVRFVSRQKGRLDWKFSKSFFLYEKTKE